jgi:hypothetical protein
MTYQIISADYHIDHLAPSRPFHVECQSIALTPHQMRTLAQKLRRPLAIQNRVVGTTRRGALAVTRSVRNNQLPTPGRQLLLCRKMSSLPMRLP